MKHKLIALSLLIMTSSLTIFADNKQPKQQHKIYVSIEAETEEVTKEVEELMCELREEIGIKNVKHSIDIPKRTVKAEIELEDNNLTQDFANFMKELEDEEGIKKVSAQIEEE